MLLLAVLTGGKELWRTVISVHVIAWQNMPFLCTVSAGTDGTEQAVQENAVLTLLHNTVSYTHSLLVLLSMFLFCSGMNGGRQINIRLSGTSNQIASSIHYWFKLHMT